MKISFASKLFERFMIFLTTSSFFLLIVTIISDVFSVNDKKNPINFLVYFAVFGLSIFYFFIFENHFSSKSKGSNIIRFVIFLTLFVVVVCFSLPEILAPAVVIPVSIFMFFFYSTLFEPYYYHDDFEEQCEGKSGEKLGNDLYHDKFTGEEVLKAIKNTKGLITVFAVIIGICICALPFTLYRFSFLTYIFSICFFGGCAYNLLLLTTYQKEIYYAFMGFEKQWDQRKTVILYSSAIIGATFLLSLLFSSNYALLKADYFRKLFGLFDKPPRQIEKIEPKQYGEMPVIPAMQDFHINDVLPDVKPNKNMEIIIFIIEILLALFLTILVLYFLLKPFRNHEFMDYLKNKKLKQIWKDFFSNLKELFIKIFSFRFKKTVYTTTDTSFFKKNVQDFIKKSKKSKEKKAELDRLTSQFVKLIEWGTRSGIQYKQNLAPAEYTDLITYQLKEKGFAEYVKPTTKCGSLFEKALYSFELLTHEEETDFKDSIKLVISLKEDLSSKE